MNRRDALKKFASSAMFAGAPLHSAVPPSPAGSATSIYNVLDYGAVCNGTTDDCSAILSAFGAMLIGGHPQGILYIPGNCYIASTLDFNCGYTNPGNDPTIPINTPSRFTLWADGLLPVSGIAYAVKIRNGYDVRANIKFFGGGSSSDAGLYITQLVAPDIRVEGYDFAGLLLHADGGAARTDIRGARLSINAQNCGQAVDIRNQGDFGVITELRDSNCVTGTYFNNVSDMTLQSYQNFSPASQACGVCFDTCNELDINVLEVGGQPTECLVKISGNSNLGRINQIRASAGPGHTCPAGVKIVDAAAFYIGSIETFRNTKGVHVRGCQKLMIGHHHSTTGESNPLYIEAGTTYTAPVVHVNANYRYCTNEAVVITSSVTGGRLVIGGEIELENISGTLPCYSINSASNSFQIFAEGLQKVFRAVLTAAFYTPSGSSLIYITGGSIANW